MMDKAQESTLCTLLLFAAVFVIILNYGKANEDQTQSEDMSWMLGNPKVLVAIVADQRPRRERDVGLNNPNNCFLDEYWSDYYRSCKACTRCSPGTQHDPQERCGYGQGEEAHCIPCEKGSYQGNDGIAVLTCRPCSVCDQRAIVERVCTRRRNTVCGRCQKGWYYDETNVCVECTEADMADFTNEDCYDKPDPTPGPKASPETQPFRDLQPAQSVLATRVPQVDGASPGPTLKPTPGEVVNPQPQTQSIPLAAALLIGGAIVICLAVGVFILHRRKYKKKNGDREHPPVINHYEVEPMCVAVGDKNPNHQPSGEANIPMQVLMPPSSHQNSSGNTFGSSSSEDPPVDPPYMYDPAGSPTRNYVTRDTEPTNPPAQLDSYLDEPFSMPRSLKSFRDGDCGAVPQVHHMPAVAEGSQAPKNLKMHDISNEVSRRGSNEDAVRNYDVAEDPSLCSAFSPLSASRI